MARKIGRIVSSAGTYVAQDGQEKKRWVNHGVVFENQGKLSVKMESFPAGGPDWSGFLSIFLDDGLQVQVTGQAQPRQQGQQRQQPQQPQWDSNDAPF